MLHHFLNDAPFRRNAQQGLLRALPVFLALQVLLLLLLLARSSLAQAAVSLASFTTQAGDGQVLVIWETASELDISAFQVMISQQEVGSYQSISPDITAEGGMTGAHYSFLVQNLENGNPYFFKLRVIHTDNSEELTEPIEAIPAEATLTPTASATLPAGVTPSITTTPTKTSTPTLTETPEAYPAPATTSPPYPGPATTSPPYPGPATSLPPAPATSPAPTVFTPAPTTLLASTPSPVVSSNQALSATTTLIPFPTITIVFPNQLALQENASGDRQAQSQALPQKSSGDQPGAGRYIPLAFILLIWLLLGGWFYLSMRRME